jgi:hypothetical protein
MSRALSLLLPLLGVVILVGCSSTVSKNELPASYSDTVNGERQVIDIHSNGTYDNTLYRQNRLVWRYRNRWNYQHEAGLGGDAITFNQFQFGLKDYDHGVAGFWLVRPERSWSGKLELCFDPDLNNRCFTKERVST